MSPDSNSKDDALEAPAQAEGTATENTPKEVVVPAESAAPTGGRKRILVVEDEKPLSHALKLKLSHEGYDITIAGDGEEGLQLAAAEKFDLILIDIIMPKMDGFTMLSRLKESGNPTTIIVLSNLGQQEDIEKAKALGVTDYMVKSNTPISRIVEAVKTTLGS